jgi:hypothetical protein
MPLLSLYDFDFVVDGGTEQRPKNTLNKTAITAQWAKQVANSVDFD